MRYDRLYIWEMIECILIWYMIQTHITCDIWHVTYDKFVSYKLCVYVYIYILLYTLYKKAREIQASDICLFLFYIPYYVIESYTCDVRYTNIIHLGQQFDSPLAQSTQHLSHPLSAPANPSAAPLLRGKPWLEHVERMAQWQQQARAARGEAAEDNDSNLNTIMIVMMKKRKEEKMTTASRPSPLPPLPPMSPEAPLLLGTADAHAFAGDAEHQVEPADPPTSGPVELPQPGDLHKESELESVIGSSRMKPPSPILHRFPRKFPGPRPGALCTGTSCFRRYWGVSKYCKFRAKKAMPFEMPSWVPC